MQKRHTAQIERLKAKIATLQRDLAAAKSAAPTPVIATAPLPSAPAPSSVGKKRPAPTDFDNAPVPAPRAIVAAPLPLDKENADAPSSVRRLSRPLSAKLSSSGDAVVPIKPELVPALHVKRDVLRAVDENASAAPVAAATAPASKVDSLKVKLQRMKQAQNAAAGISTA